MRVAVAASMAVAGSIQAVTALPYPLPIEGEVVNIHLNSLSSVNPCPGDACWYSENDGMDGPAANWCGAIYAPDYGTHGAWVTRGGGHGGYNGVELHLFDIGTGRWSVVGSTPPDGAWLLTLDATWGDYSYGGGYIVPADHTYNLMVYIGPDEGGGAQGSMLVMCSTYGGFDGYRPHAIDLATGVSTRFTTGVYTPYMAFGAYGGAFVDTNRHVAWGVAGIENNTNCKIDLTATPKVVTAVSSFFTGGLYFNPCFAPEADMTLGVWSKSGEPNVNLVLYDMSSGTPTIVTLTTATDLPKFALDAYSVAWHPGTKKFYIYGGIGQTVIHTLTPPALYANWTTQNWTWGTETPTGAAFANVLEVVPGASGAHPFNKMLFHPPTNCLMWTNGLCVRTSPDAVSRDGAFQLYRPIGAEVI